MNSVYFRHLDRPTNMGVRRIVSRDGQIKGLETTVPQWGPGDEKSWKWCINNWSTGRFTVTTNAQNISRGSAPLAHAYWIFQ